MLIQENKIPSVPELLKKAGNFGYAVSQPDNSHTYVYLELDSNHQVLPCLVQYALLVMNGLILWEKQITEGKERWPDFSGITYEQMKETIEALERKPCKHYRGWLGETIIHFLIHHLLTHHNNVFGYIWQAIAPIKAEVTDGELDIVAAYELNGNQFGHISGEIKTYENLSDAKSRAYSDLDKAFNWTNNRGAQIRSTLNQLFHQQFGVGAIAAAVSAMGDERSFLPGLLHSDATKFKHKSTFEDLPSRFNICKRPSQLIGIQIVISDFGSSCDITPFAPGFFENFLKQLHLQAIEWKQLPKSLPNV